MDKGRLPALGKRGKGRMNGYHCLNCGEKLKQLSMSLSTDKYECPKCGTEWYKVRHIIVEWVEGEKKESEVEYDG